MRNSKKLISLVLAVLMAVSMMPFSAISASAATSGKCGANINWTLNNGILTLTGSGSMYDYKYYGDSNHAPWQSQSSPNYDIKQIVVGNGITRIGNHAFSNCSNLTSVSLPNTVTEIGQSAFDSDYKLPSIVLPANLTKIDYSAFMSCGLTSINIPNKVTTIGDSAFFACRTLASAVVPDSVTSLGNSAFYACEALKSVTLPSNLTAIPNSLFNGCKSLESIDIPSTVTSIGYNSFNNCRVMESIELPSGVTSIGSSAFAYCVALKDINIPSGVTSIGYSAFQSCIALENIELPSGITTINYSFFKNCSSLESITIPSNITYIDHDAFSGCTALSTVTFERPNTAHNLTLKANVFDENQSLAYTGSGNLGLFDGETVLEEGATLSDYNSKTLAWDVTTPEGEAAIGSTTYETFAEALTAAQTGDTITLLKDVAIDSTIVINDGRNITIDTNGKEISSTVRVFEIRHGGVTLTGDGTVSTTAVSAVAVYGSTNSADADYATFTLDEGTTISATSGYGAMIGANSKAAYGAKLTINGTIDSKYGVYVNGTVQEPADKTNAAQVTINGTVTAGSENAAVYAAGYAKWTVNDGAAITGGSGIYIKSGDLVVNGGTITANGTKTAYVFNSNGANGTGDAIIIDSCGYPGNVPTVAINDGTITSANGAAVASYAKQDDPRYPDASFEKVDEVIPGNSTAVFSSDVSALAEEGYETVYDTEAGGYVVEEITYDNGVSITVTNTIKTNFYLDNKYPETAYVKLYYNKNSNATETSNFTTEIKAITSLDTYTGGGAYDGDYMVSILQAPAQITETVTIGVYATQADAQSGTNALYTKEYNAASYCNDILAGDYDAKLKTLAQATLDYGAAANDYFEYGAVSAASDYASRLAGVTPSGVAPQTANILTGAALVVVAEPQIKLFTNGPVAVNGSTNANAAAEVSGDKDFIRVTGIAPANFGQTFTVNTSEGEISMSMNTILGMMAGNANMEMLAKGMYNYGTAAAAYFAG